AVLWGLVALGVFEFGVNTLVGSRPADAGASLLVAIVAALVLLRVPVSSEPAPRRDRRLAERALEAFAWINVALGLALIPALHSELFSSYRRAMAQTFFDNTALPSPLWPWLD